MGRTNRVFVEQGSGLEMANAGGSGGWTPRGPRARAVAAWVTAVVLLELCRRSRPGAAAALAAAPVQPYGANDAGGFRNVLPPGENGTDNARQLARIPPERDLPAPLHRPAAAVREPAPRLADAHPRTDRRLLQGRHLRRRRRRRRIERKPALGRDDRARQGLRGAAHLRHHARGADVRRGLRRRGRPPVPDGRAPPHRRARNCPRSRAARKATARWTGRSG